MSAQPDFVDPDLLGEARASGIGDAQEQPGSLLDQLAQKREDIANNKETFVPVPGYDREPPMLLVKYRLLEGPEMDRIIQNVRTQFRNRWERTMYAGVDTFIAACLGVYVDKGDGLPVILTVDGEDVTGFSRALAKGLKFEESLGDADNPREVVFGLFGNNDVMISQHNYLLNRWFGDTSLKVSREMFEEGNL